MNRSRHWLFLLFVAFALTGLEGASKQTELLQSTEIVAAQMESGDGYTINFDNVSMSQLIRFMSQIAHTNFVFKEDEVRFNVTFISEEEATLGDVMAAFTQILRINNLTILEDGDNLLITANPDVRQIPTIVSDEVPFSGKTFPAYVTRVFRIKNNDPSRIAAVLRPMLSADAILEVMPSTRQLIVTDTTLNVNQVARLLMSLDTPQTTINIGFYESRLHNPADLINIGRELIVPIAEGLPFSMINPVGTDKIYIISTDYLIQKTQDVLSELDSTKQVVHEKLTSNNVLIFPLHYTTPQAVEEALRDIINKASGLGYTTDGLLKAVNNAKYIKTTNSLMFVANKNDIDRLKELLTQVDQSIQTQPHGTKGSYFIYTPKEVKPDNLIKRLQQVANTFEKNGLADQSLIDTINSVHYLPSSQSLVFTGSSHAIDQIKTLLSQIDVTKDKQEPSSFYIYKIKSATEKQLAGALDVFVNNLSRSQEPNEQLINTIKSMRWIKDTNSLIFTGPEPALKQIQEILPSFDVVNENERIAQEKSAFYIYKIKNNDEGRIIASLNQFANALAKSANPDLVLIKSIKSVTYDREAETLTFTGPHDVLNKLRDIVPTFDQVTATSAESAFYIYKIKHDDESRIITSAEQLATTLEKSPNPDTQLINTLKSASYDKDNHTLTFTGTQSSIEKIKQIVPTFDVEGSVTSKTEFFMYTPKNVPAEQLIKSLEDVAKNLNTSGLSDPEFINTLTTARFVPSSDAILFTGSAKSISRVKSLLGTLDDARTGTALSENMLIFTPKYATQKEIETALDKFIQPMPSDSSMRKIIENLNYLSHSNSFIFRGPNNELQRIKQVLDATDVKTQTEPVEKTYFVYKLKYNAGDTILQDLNRVSRNLRQSDVESQTLLKAIHNIEWVKSTNTLFITGTQKEVDQIKALVSEFDVPDGHSKKPIEPTSSFYIYKPKYMKPQELEASLRSLADDLEKSGLSDPQLLKTIQGMRFAKSTQSLLFTGTDESIKRLKELLEEIDNSSLKKPIQHVGHTTFLIYKLKYASPSYMQNSLKAMATDLADTKGSDQDLVRTLRTARYVAETNSFIFTGSKQVLEKVQDILDRFDIASAQAKQPTRPPPSGYILYKPKYVPGEELISTLQDFENNLKQSGIVDEELYDVIQNLKYMAKTQSILVSGPAKETEKVQQLLERFDIPGKGKESPISDLEDFSFLVYRIQYHNGYEISKALKDIVYAIPRGETGQNKQLLDAINTLQWIPATNALIATGEPKVLSRLRELIKGLDIPLKQVFIEVLVIQTTPIGKLDFGLQWGSQGKYRDRFAYAGGLFPTTESGGTSTFSQNLFKINETNKPTGSDLPNTPGGSLGVIGDVILHKGKSYFAFGPFLNALQSQTNASVILDQKIMAQDNLQSQIFVGDNLPFAGSSIDFTGANRQQTTNLEYRDIGVTLQITPNIGDDDIITLDIYQEISAQNPNSTGQNSQPQSATLGDFLTSKSTFQTRVHVPDRHFLILSGMIRDSESKEIDGLPCLGGLPVIGAAFTRKDNTDTKSSIVMFVRPHIVKSTDIYKQITEKQEELFRGVAEGSRSAYDRGIEYVKDPEDF